MADFIKAYKITCNFEGGWSNDKDDSGGETWKGLTRNYEPNWAGWTIVDKYKNLPGFPKNMDSDIVLEKLVQIFYQKTYWKCDDVVNQLIANDLFDTAVNCGIETAGMFIQDCLNVGNRGGFDYEDIKVDGIIGQKTVMLINGYSRQAELLKAFNCLQGARYIDLCKQKPKFEKFYRSWMSRVMENWTLNAI